ncbi:MAG: hypothetical protein R2827_12105 [Bdellovibrionales bacterium]
MVFASPFICKGRYEQDVHATVEELGCIMGVLFQRSDDLLDFDVRNAENKAVMGDLKSGYMNSFAVALADGLTAKQREMFLQSKTVDEIKKAVGAEHFNAKLKDFDAVNENPHSDI